MPSARFVGGTSRALCECPKPTECEGVQLVEKIARLSNEIGLFVTNERNFYDFYARPYCEKWALLNTCKNAGSIAHYRRYDCERMADRALAWWNVEGRKSSDLFPEFARETEFLKLWITGYLWSHYAPSEYEPQRLPYGGNAIRSNPAWKWGGKSAEGLGIIGGPSHQPTTGSTTFNCYQSAFMGPSSKYSRGAIYCSCSGGPATIATLDAVNAVFTGEFHVQKFWQWREMPEAGGGVEYETAVPVWLCDLN